MIVVEYTIGAFLTEMDIVKHTLPEVPIEHLTTDMKIKNMKNAFVHFDRKTEQTTKKRFKSPDNQ